jgi:hypothetical protein
MCLVEYAEKATAFEVAQVKPYASGIRIGSLRWSSRVEANRKCIEKAWDEFFG